MRPADFSATYMGFSGPLPPPHYWEHVIRIGPGPQGSLEVTAGYPGPGTPVWRESFALGEEHLEWLFGICTEQGLFTLDWPPATEVPVGGGSRKLSVTAAGRSFDLPPFVTPERADAALTILGAVRALLPPGLWESMEARRTTHARQPSPVPGPPHGLTRTRIVLFEENHVAIATFLGTPVAGGTLMALNAFRVGNPITGVVIIAFGLILSIVELYFTLSVNATGSRGANLFSLVAGIIGALIMRGVASWLQGDQIAAHARAGGESASGWQAVGIGAVYLVIILMLTAGLGLLSAGR